MHQSVCMHCCSRLSFSLKSQTHFRKKGKGMVNYVYKPCPATLYSVVQSHLQYFDITSLFEYQ